MHSLRIFLLGSIFLFSSLGCSQVGFSVGEKSMQSLTRSDAESEDYLEEDAPENDRSPTPTPTSVPPTPVIPKSPDFVSMKWQQNFPAQPEKNDPITVVLWIDDSASNLKNLEPVLAGLSNLVDKLPASLTELVAYTTGSFQNTFPYLRIGQTSSLRDGHIGDRWYFSTWLAPQSPLARKFAGDRPLTSVERGEFVQNLATHIKERLQKISTASPSDSIFLDWRPSFECETLAKVAELASSGASRRVVFVAITDEDSFGGGSNCVQGTESEYSVKQHTNMQTAIYSVPVEYKHLLEGGEFVWTSGGLYVPSCPASADTINALLANNPNLRATSDTFSLCHTSSIDQRTYTVWDKLLATYFVPWLGSPGFKPTTYAEQMALALKVIPQTQIFYGAFIVKSEAEIKNPDQEVPKSFLSYLAKYFLPLNTRTYSILSNSYGSFVDDVLSFQSNTAKNQIDISNLLQSIPAGKILKIKSVLVTAQGGRPVNIAITAFTRSGSTLLLSDLRVNASLGITVEVEYEIN